MKRLLLTIAGLGLAPTLAVAQTQAVKGVVVDASTGETVIGASVLVKGHSGVGVATDLDGRFSLNVPKGATHLVISYVGYKKVEVAIKPNMTIKLESDSQVMDDVVIVGYGSGRKVASMVSSVVTLKAKDLAAKPNPNPLESLQGKVAGLQLFVNSGEPSQTANIRIRGNGSLGAESYPLYILDGAPVEPSTIRGLNTNDIASVQILKDASATSIYGARAANGVIYITTKRGTSGERASVTIRGQYGLSSLANKSFYKGFMNADELLAFSKEIGLRDDAAIKKIKEKYPNDISWADYVYQDNKPSYQTDISVSGGMGSTQYYLSVARQAQEGLRHGSDYAKTAFRLNLNTALNKYVSIGSNNSLSMDKYHVNPFSSNDITGGLAPIIQPWYSPYDKDGNEVDFIEGLKSYTAKYLTTKTDRLNSWTILNSSSFVQIKPLKDLVLRSQFSYERKNLTYDYLRLPSHLAAFGNGEVQRENSNIENITWTNTVEYKLDWGRKHNITALLGHEYVSHDSDYYKAGGKGLTNDLLTTLDKVTKEKSLAAGIDQYAFLSFFGRLSYEYANRYFADLTIRNDASSRFGKNNRSATFWSIGLMWKPKEESFLKNVSWINDAKLKYSIGTQGNSQIGNYSAYTQVSKIGQADGVIGWGLNDAGNPNLSWEKQFSTSLGLELLLFDRLNINLELYHRLTSDMLMDVPYPYHTGFIDGSGWNNITQNVGKYQNRGIDLELGYQILKGKNNNGLRAYLNVNYNTDKVVELFQGLDSWTIPNTSVSYIVGSPVMYFYPIWAGVNPKNGDAQWYVPGSNNAIKRTEETTTTYSQDLEQNTGIRRYAPWNGGFGFNAKYGSVSLDADFVFSLGKYMIGNDSYFFENPSVFVGYNQRRTVRDYWKKEGDVTTFPRYGVKFTEFDSRMIQNASFARLKTITLGYTVASSLLKKQNILKGAKVYVTGRNLLTFTSFQGPDPEVDSNLTLGANPNTKQVVVGLELNF